MKLDPSQQRTKHIYGLMTSLIVPRPIAWVGSRSVEGIDNLAPFSYFMGVSSKPPALAISVARGRGMTLKDTAKNILETGVFTVSTVGAALAEQMVLTSGRFSPDISEFAEAGLPSCLGDRVNAPRPTVASATMECRLIHQHDMGSVHLLVGEVVLFHLADDDVITQEDGGIVMDSERLQPLARLGGTHYAELGRIRDVKPPST